MKREPWAINKMCKNPKYTIVLEGIHGREVYYDYKFLIFALISFIVFRLRKRFDIVSTSRVALKRITTNKLGYQELKDFIG